MIDGSLLHRNYLANTELETLEGQEPSLKRQKYIDLSSDEFLAEIDRLYASVHRSIDNVIMYIASWYYFDEKRLLGDKCPLTPLPDFRDDPEKYIRAQVDTMKASYEQLNTQELEYYNYLVMHLRFRSIYSGKKSLLSKLEALYLYHESIFFEHLEIGQPIAVFQKVYSDAPERLSFAFLVLLMPYIYIYASRIWTCKLEDLISKITEVFYQMKPEYSYIFAHIDTDEYIQIVTELYSNHCKYLSGALSTMSISEITLEMWSYLLATKPSDTVITCHAILTGEDISMVTKLLKESML